MPCRSGRTRVALVAAPIVCALLLTLAAPQVAQAASAKASCAPSPGAAAKRLKGRVVRHARLSKTLRRAARRMRARGRYVRARKAMRASRRHRRVARRTRARARVCVVAARRLKNDRTPPAVRFRVPAESTRISGNWGGSACEATAGDNVGVARVEFSAAGRALNTDQGTPYRCWFDTTTVPDGVYTLQARAYDAAGNSSLAEVTVEVANAGGASTGSPAPSGAGAVGVEGGIRWRTGADLVNTIARLRAAGATYTRESIAWYRVEPNRGQWDFSGIDPWVAEAARQGLRITALLDGPPAWATGSTDRKVAPVTGQPLTDYANYARKLVERYGSEGTFWAANPQLPKLPIVEWDVWNEPYQRWFWRNTGTHAWPDPEGYAEMFRAVASEASKADPNAKFMAEVEVATDDANNEPFLTKMFDAVPDLAAHMDIASAHPYVNTDGRSPTVCAPEVNDMSNRYNFCRVKTIRRILDREGAAGAKLWLTEFGYSTCASCGKWQVTESVQAQHVRDAFRMLRQWRVADGFIWWVYKAGESAPTAEDWMGLVHADGSPKPAWDAFSEEARAGL